MNALARPAEKPLRVMIVDDSTVVRGMLGKWLAETPGIEVVAVAVDGLDAVKKAALCNPELCLLDVEMPNLSGLDALPQIIAAAPGVKVIMASAMTTSGATITMRAMDLGAIDCIAKPSARDQGGALAYREALTGKLRALGAALRGRAAPRPAPMAQPGAARPAAAPAAPAKLSAPGRQAPELIVIGSSTGGPPALNVVLRGLAKGLKVPVLIAQHMPAGFTEIMAKHLAQATGLDIAEGTHEGPVLPGQVRVAPGGMHMSVARRDGQFITLLDQNPPENFCRPSVEPLFRTAAAICGERLLAIMLTGMGHDGRDGTRTINQKGGRVIAQDEASSVVWGMPGAVVEAGLAHSVLPLPMIATAALGCFTVGAR